MPEKGLLQSDVIIIGGGLSGLTLACILGQSGLTVLCVDVEDPQKILNAAYDGRTTAISAGSRTVLEQAGIWKDLEKDACPIRDIHITDNGSPVLLEFLSKDVNADAFGWIVENLTLRQVLFKRAKTIKNIRLEAPAKVTDYAVQDDNVRIHLDNGNKYAAKLVIGADGRQSTVRNWMEIDTRSWSYHQTAIVCAVTHDNPHRFIAVEDFRSEGPFAILPMQDSPKGVHRSSVVWSHHGLEKSSPLHWDIDVFNAALTSRFPDWYGNVRLIGTRYSFPLGLIHATHYIAPRMALIADAAHGIHPIAGQGLNLGFRDIDSLSDLLIAAHNSKQDIGGSDLLSRYEQSRRFDNTVMAGATDLLNRLFSNPVSPIKFVRRLGLSAVQKIKPAKTFFMRQAMGRK